MKEYRAAGREKTEMSLNVETFRLITEGYILVSDDWWINNWQALEKFNLSSFQPAEHNLDKSWNFIYS